MVDAIVGFHVPQVADRNVDGHAVHGAAQILELVHVDQDFQVPAEILDALGEAAHRRDAVERHAALVADVDAGAAHTPGMECLELGVGDVLVDGGDGHELAVHPVDGVQHARIVGAVDAGLGQHGTPDPAQGPVQGEEGLEARVGWRVAARGRQRVLAVGAEDMGVTIDGVRRQFELRGRRIGVGSQARRVFVFGHRWIPSSFNKIRRWRSETPASNTQPAMVV